MTNPVKLTFENLNFTGIFQTFILLVTQQLNRKEYSQGKRHHKTIEILKNLSGYALPGETLFIMGSSGAGKTTLLNVLSDRIAVRKGSTLTGHVYIND